MHPSLLNYILRQPIKLKPSLRNFLVLVFFIGLTGLYFSPVLKNLSSFLPDDNDSVVITWHLHKIEENKSLIPSVLFKGNILYPFPYSQAYTDPFLADSLIAYPFIKLSGEPIVAYNVNLLLSQVLLLFFFFLFLKQLTGDFLISVVLSVIFGFSEIRLHYLGHLQMFSLYWIPLAGYFLLKFEEVKKTIFLYFFFLSFLAQTLNSFLPGYFIAFMSLGIIWGRKNLRELLLKNLKHVVFGFAIVALILLPYLKIYFFISSYFNYSRPIRDAVNFSLSPEEIFSKFLSPLVLFLFLVSLLSFVLRKRIKSAGCYLWMTGFFYLVSLGPALHFLGRTIKINFWGSWLPIPLPYFLFYYLLPGFNAFRTPSRWVFMFAFSATVFTGLIIAEFLSKRKNSTKFIFYGCLLFLGIVSGPPKRTYYQFPTKSHYPAVYSWLSRRPEGVVLELPIYYWRDYNLAKTESKRMLFALTHEKKTVNGITGFSPLEEESLVNFLQKNFPNQESIKKIKTIGVDLLVLHSNELRLFWKDDYEEKMRILNQNESLRKVYDKGGDLVYAIVQ